MKDFFSSSRGQIVAVVAALAAGYLALTALLLVGAAREYTAAGTAEGSFVWGFSFLATLPLSWWVGDGENLWTLAAYALCALINAITFCVVVVGSASVAIRLSSAVSERRLQVTDHG